MNDTVNEVDKFIEGWSGGLPETPCGAGSTMKATLKQREWIPKLITQYNINHISDIGAGDLNWIKTIEIHSDVKYTPFDLIPRRPEVIRLDILNEVPRKTDLIMCLWVFNHFKNSDVVKALKNIKDSGSKYLLVTQRCNYYAPDFEILDSIILNNKMDSMLMVKL